MSTQVYSKHPDQFPDDRLVLNNEDGPGLVVHNQGRTAAVRVDRADFIAAVESELGVIVIDKGKPLEAWEVELLDLDEGLTPEAARERGSHYFAYAAYLEANPPVDEAKVEALAEFMAGVERKGSYPGDWDFGDLARYLLATGRIDVKDPS